MTYRELAAEIRRTQKDLRERFLLYVECEDLEDDEVEEFLDNIPVFRCVCHGVTIAAHRTHYSDKDDHFIHVNLADDYHFAQRLDPYDWKAFLKWLDGLGEDIDQEINVYCGQHTLELRFLPNGKLFGY